MAKTLGIKRSTGQAVTIDTVNGVIAPLGPVLSSLPTSVTTYPCRIQNSTIVYKGDPYALVVTTVNNIEIRKYDLATNLWGTSISFGPAVGGNQAPLCLQIVNDNLVCIWTESNGVASVASATYFNGTYWASRVNSGPDGNLNGNLGGPSTIWRNAVIFATKAGIGNYFIAGGFGTAFDQGSDPSITNPLIANSTAQGSFSYWNGDLYYLQPDTSIGAKLYKLDPAWGYPAPAAPQWSSIATTGLVSAGALTLTGDIGNYALFVDKYDNLCAFYSGATSTKLVRTTAATFPTFTDLTSSILTSDISTKSNVGISFYNDDRRRGNELQYFLIRNSATLENTLKLVSWDGLNQVIVKKTFTDHDYMLGSGKPGEFRTYTAQQPAINIINVNSTQIASRFSTITVVALSGVVSVGDTFTITGTTTASGTVFSVSGTTYTLDVTSGTVPNSGAFLDNTSLATATLSTVINVPTTISSATLSGIAGTISPTDRYTIVGTTNSTGIVESISGNIVTLNVATGVVPTSGAFTDTTSAATATMGGTVINSAAFPGRAVITYLVKDVLGRNVDVFGEYSVDGDQWSPMTQGAGDSGSVGLNTSSSGVLHTYFWDAYADLEGSFDNLFMRLVARISVPSNELAPSSFVPVIQEDYMRSPVFRSTSNLQISINTPSKAYTPNESFTTNNSGTTGLVQTSIATIPVTTTASFAAGDTFSVVNGPLAATGVIKQLLAGPARLVLDVLTVTGSFPTAGTITDTVSSATATVTGAPTVVNLTLTNVSGSLLYTDTLTGSTSTAAGVVTTKRTLLNISNSTGTISIGQTLTGGTSGASGTIVFVSSSIIIVDVSTGLYTVGETVTTTGPGSAKVRTVSQTAVSNSITPADETVNLEEYTTSYSIANRGRDTYVFQGRLSSNQTKLRSAKFTVRGIGTSPYPKFKVSIFVSGFGANNQYTGSFKTFTSLPASDTEVVIDQNEISNQPSLTGKRYSIVVEYEANTNETVVCSTPYFRHE